MGVWPPPTWRLRRRVPQRKLSPKNLSAMLRTGAAPEVAKFLGRGGCRLNGPLAMWVGHPVVRLKDKRPRHGCQLGSILREGGTWLLNAMPGSWISGVGTQGPQTHRLFVGARTLLG